MNTLDPILQCDALYTNPDPGKNVARIGAPFATEGMVGAGCDINHLDAAAEKLEYTYEITKATSVLKYRFATVLQIPDEGGDHEGPERPFFSINIKVVKPDGTVAIPPCSSYDAVVNDDESSTLLRGTAPCTASRTDPSLYMYQPWTSVLVDLREFEGSRVFIEVISHDCLVRCTANTPAAGGHEAYGYFRAEATSYQLKAMACNGNDLELIAPEGYAKYEWRASLGDAPVIRNENEPNKAYLDPTRMQIGATYYCDMYDQMHCSKITIEAQVDPVQLTPNYSYENFCNGKVQFTDMSTAVGDEIVGWLWDFGDGAKSNLQHPQHEYSEPKEYTVTLTVTSSKGCSETLQGTVNVRYFPKLNIQSEPFVCAG